jgi:hypothetical protein
MSMFNDEDVYSRVQAAAIESAMELAAETDDLTEIEAVAAVANTIDSWRLPPEVIALMAATLTVRMRRTRLTESIVNNRGPGQ